MVRRPLRSGKDEQRLAQRRQRRRRFVQIGLGLLACGLLIESAAAWVSAPTFLPVSKVRVEGELTRLDKQQMGDRVAQHLRGNFLFLDVAALRQSIEELAWVARASVHRQWPDTVVVRVWQQQALAYWNENRLMNRAGHVYAPDVLDIGQQLPAFSGPDGSAESVAGMYYTLSSGLAERQLRIQHLVLSDRRAWTVVLDNGLEVVLGRHDPQQRLARFLEVWPAVLKTELASIQRVDMRYANGFAVRWKSQQRSQSLAITRGVAA